MERVLSGLDTESVEEEKWLKEMMHSHGFNYLSKEQQEEALEDVREEINEAKHGYDPNNLHIDFEGFE